MSYTALYRKLRPRAFSEVIGQNHIIRTLQNQLTGGRVSHAYLFCGTRGTGKTSTAKIFARAVNCQALKDGEACGACPACEAIDSGRSLNVIEIDAASNNGVENIRDIREEVKYPPAEGRYKIYIIDEVHMLSTGAFNALLKTLEEPPEHVMFILATTDPQKIPATVHSRCQRFDFKRIQSAEITATLKKYIQAEQSGSSALEGISIDDDALMYIASVCDGAMRDALSILDQCLAVYFGSHITASMVRDITGAADSGIFFSLTDALFRGNSRLVMELISELVANGRDIQQFAAELVLHLRNLLVAGSVGQGSTALDFSAENIAQLAAQAGEIPVDVIMSYVHAFSQLQPQLKYAANERVLLEVLCLRLAGFIERNEQGAVIREDLTLARIKYLEDAVKDLSERPADMPPSISPATAPTDARAAQKEPPAPPAIKKSTPDDIGVVIKDWAEFVALFNAPVKTYLQKATPCYLDGGLLYLVSPASSDMLKKHQNAISDKLTEKFSREFELAFATPDEFNQKHKRLYGAEDDSLTISPESFTEMLNMDIIVED